MTDALKRKKSDDTLEIIANFGDPMMPVCAGMLSSASKNCHVILAGGTQMLAVSVSYTHLTLPTILLV